MIIDGQCNVIKQPKEHLHPPKEYIKTQTGKYVSVTIPKQKLASQWYAGVNRKHTVSRRTRDNMFSIVSLMPEDMVKP